MMAVLTELIVSVRNWIRNERISRVPSREERISRALLKIESCVIFLQTILIWENPTLSALSLFGFNALFWFVVGLEFRPYFLLFATLLVGLIYEMWVEQLWSEEDGDVASPAEPRRANTRSSVSPRVLTVPELSHYFMQTMEFIHNRYMWLKAFRRDQPGGFCCLMTLVSLFVMWLGMSVSGTMLLYLLFLCLLFTPGICIHLLPHLTSEKLLELHDRLGETSSKDNTEEEFLPDQTGENLIVLQQASDIDHSDHEDDEEFNMSSADLLKATNSTNIDPPQIFSKFEMPAPEDLSLDSTDFSFNLAQPPSTSETEMSAVKCKTEDLKELSVGDTDSEEDNSSTGSNGIHFQTLHFKGDSSSEEDASSKRSKKQQQSELRRDERKSSSSGIVADAAAAVLSYSTAGAQNLASLGVTMGQSLISSVMNSAVSQPSTTVGTVLVKEEDSDTEDFELISEEEFANL